MKKTVALTITLVLGASGIAMADHPETGETDERLFICTTSLAFLVPVLGVDCGPQIIGPPVPAEDPRGDDGDRNRRRKPPVESAPSDG